MNKPPPRRIRLHLDPAKYPNSTAASFEGPSLGDLAVDRESKERFLSPPKSPSVYPTSTYAYQAPPNARKECLTASGMEIIINYSLSHNSSDTHPMSTGISQTSPASYTTQPLCTTRKTYAWPFSDQNSSCDQNGIPSSSRSQHPTQ